MLNIDIDSKWGILFVRLFGRLTNETSKKFYREVESFINEVGIQNVVINIQNLFYVDKNGMKMIEKCYKMCSTSLLCINPNQVNIIQGFKFVTDEMSAVNLINV